MNKPPAKRATIVAFSSKPMSTSVKRQPQNDSVTGLRRHNIEPHTSVTQQAPITSDFTRGTGHNNTIRPRKFKGRRVPPSTEDRFDYRHNDHQPLKKIQRKQKSEKNYRVGAEDLTPIAWAAFASVVGFLALMGLKYLKR